jgi:hypothetical protein
MGEPCVAVATRFATLGVALALKHWIVGVVGGGEFADPRRSQPRAFKPCARRSGAFSTPVSSGDSRGANRKPPFASRDPQHDCRNLIDDA